MTPERFHDLLLDHLYDLLDEPEAGQMRAYLEAHPEAQAEAERVRALLAGAARSEFPTLRFSAPVEDAVTAPVSTPAPSAPTPAPAVSRTGPMRWHWVVTACVVLALGIGAIPVSRHVLRYRDARGELAVAERNLELAQVEKQQLMAERRKQLEEAAEQVQKAQAAINELQVRRLQELQELQQEAASMNLELEVTGPPAIQPGAPNQFHIATRNRADGRIVPSKLNIRVVDDKNRVLFEEKDAQSQGLYTLHLPPNLEFRPNTQLALDVTASSEGQVRSELNERLSWAAPRYITHLTTDKPLYQPGQTVFFRSLTLNRASLKPPEEDFHVVFTITDPSGAEVYRKAGETRLMKPTERGQQVLLGPDGKPVRGIGVGEFFIPDTPDVAGGEWTLTVAELNHRFPTEKRKFTVNKYTPDRLNKELEFHKKSYGPGEEVIANCKVSPADKNEGPRNIVVAGASANVDGTEVTAVPLGPVDPLGRVRIRFELPQQMERGRVSLSVTFSDGGALETIQKPVPVVLKKLFVEFFPEGGDLVAGVPNRVYFQVKSPLDKPAEMKGHLLDSGGKEVAQLETFSVDDQPGANHGLGVFEFVPKLDEKYTVRVLEPAGIEAPIPLTVRGGIKSDGVTLKVPTGVTGDNQSIRVELQVVGKARSMLVGAYSRGRLLDHQRVEVKPGEVAAVELKPVDHPGGVVRITAFEETGGEANRKTFLPRAERLVYRQSTRAVKYKFEPNKPRYAPGEPVTLTITATDEKDKPVRGVALISVVNQTVVTMADEKTARALPTHFALTGEVRNAEDLEHADFLLGSHPKAPVALDLLLGVQGWRRFVEQSPQQFQHDNAPLEAERILALSGQMGQRVVRSLDQKRQAIERDFEVKFKELAEQQQNAEDAFAAVQGAAEYQAKLLSTEAELQEHNDAYRASLAKIRQFDDLHTNLRRNLLPLLALATLVVGVLLVGVGLVVGLKRGAPYLVGAAVAIGACVLLLVGSSVLDLPQRGKRQLVEGNVSPMDPMATPDEQLERLAEGSFKAAPQNAMEFVPQNRPAPAPPLAAVPDDLRARNRAEMQDGPMKFDGNQGPGAPREFKRAASPKEDPQRRDAMQQSERLAVPGAGRMARGGDKPVQQRLAKSAEPAMRPLAQEQQKDAGFRPVAKPNAMDLTKKMQAPQAARAPAQPFAGGGGPAGRARLGGAGGAMPAGPGGLGGFGRAAAGPAGLGGPGMAELGPGGPAANLAMPGFRQASEVFIYREFAHVHVPGEDNARSDFAETLYWNPAAVFDESGKATVQFHLADAVTRYRVLAAGHTLDGRLGQDTYLLEARKSFSLDARLPIEMTRTDKLYLPVVVANDTSERFGASIEVQPENLRFLAGNAQEQLEIDANKSGRRIFKLEPTVAEGQAKLRVAGSGQFGEDAVERIIPIVPDGFPAGGARSDLFASDLLEKVARQEVVLPEDYIKGTLKLSARIYPSTLADLQQGLDALLREPYGCFEQTSTSNYPNTLILNYIQESGQSNPAAVQRARELLDRGYQKLTSFECVKPSGGREGYEWFGGQAPPHEALTAYGLMQFKDMAKVHPVDAEMLKRTRQYLLSRRKPEGGFERNTRALDTFGRAPQHITDAYIIWALTETGPEDMTRDIDKLLKDHADSSDPYFLSLLANAMLNGGGDRRTQAIELLKRVRQRQTDAGNVAGATTSITCSGGRDLEIEATALAVLGWLKVNEPREFTEPLSKAIRWISRQRGGYGGFGSTQSTILALKALINYTKQQKQTAEGGELRLFAGEQLIGRTQFAAGTQEAVTIEVSEPEKFVKPGKNELRLELNTKGAYPFTIAWSYASLTPPSSEKCQVRLTTKLDKDRVAEGEAVRLNVTLDNVAAEGKGLPMTVAVIGLPAGLRPPEDLKQLKEMAKLRKTGPDGALEEGEISFFEMRGRELVLYWRHLKPGAKIDLAIDLIAAVPGEFRGPASRAYLYYNADYKSWTRPLGITIDPVSGE